MRLGKGHIEINFARALLDVLWHPVASEVAKMLGFHGVVRKGVDHHRSKQILHIVEGLTLELLRLCEQPAQ